MNIAKHHVRYPEITFWDKNIPAEDRINIINKEDLPVSEILEGLGIRGSSLTRSFGITDKKEILNRQSLVQFFVENPKFMNFILEENSASHIPMEKTEFLHFFNNKSEHNPYWNYIHNLLDHDDDLKTPETIRKFFQVIHNSLPLEETENQVIDFLKDRVNSVAYIGGVATFRLDYNKRIYASDLKDIEVLGHQVYSHEIENVKIKDVSTLNPIKFINYKKQLRAKEKSYKQALKESVISEASPHLLDDLRQGLLSIFKDLDLKWRIWEGGKISIHFYYDADGLHIACNDLAPNSSYFDAISSKHKDIKVFENFPGYSAEQIKVVRELKKKHGDLLKRNYFQRSAAREIQQAVKEEVEKNKHFFGRFYKVSSPNTDKKHKWFALKNLLVKEEIKEAYESIVEHRKYVSRNISALREVAHLSCQFVNSAKELNTSLCYPEIYEEGNISFNEILPLHLISKIKKLVPIKCLSNIGQEIVCFTGQHGGGKSTTSLTIPGYIYLAQSGLPVFGKGFSFNIKKTLGLLFISKGNGSTCEILIDKIRNILKGIKKSDPKEVLLVLDELGTGTQESSGYELGMDLLSKLYKDGISTIFSTQILKLAEEAKLEFKAECFCVDEKHNITKGIGDGGMSRLRKRKGIDKLLKV